MGSQKKSLNQRWVWKQHFFSLHLSISVSLPFSFFPGCYLSEGHPLTPFRGLTSSACLPFLTEGADGSLFVSHPLPIPQSHRLQALFLRGQPWTITHLRLQLPHGSRKRQFWVLSFGLPLQGISSSSPSLSVCMCPLFPGGSLVDNIYRGLVFAPPRTGLHSIASQDRSTLHLLPQQVYPPSHTDRVTYL